MARPLIINERVRSDIAKVIAYAVAHPIPFDLLREHAVPKTTVLELKDRKPGLVRPKSASVEIPIGFRAALSVEEQPAGLCWHLSISVEKRGKTPNPAAAMAIAEEFGMRPPFHAGWLEEFEPGHHAVNFLSLKTPREEGIA
jgi:hypothetical protein